MSQHQWLWKKKTRKFKCGEACSIRTSKLLVQEKPGPTKGSNIKSAPFYIYININNLSLNLSSTKLSSPLMTSTIKLTTIIYRLKTTNLNPPTSINLFNGKASSCQIAIKNSPSSFSPSPVKSTFRTSWLVLINKGKDPESVIFTLMKMKTIKVSPFMMNRIW